MKAQTPQSSIARNAADAIKIVADAAQRAIESTNSRYLNDHDLLVELKTQMIGIKEDIKDLKDGTSRQIADHEIRLNTLETSKIKQTVLLSIGTGILSILVSLLVFHLFQGV
jgi:hypothetical protein